MESKEEFILCHSRKVTAGIADEGQMELSTIGKEKWGFRLKIRNTKQIKDARYRRQDT